MRFTSRILVLSGAAVVALSACHHGNDRNGRGGAFAAALDKGTDNALPGVVELTTDPDPVAPVDIMSIDFTADPVNGS